MPQENEEFAGVAFVTGEENQWSGKEELKKYKNPRSQETSHVTGFFAAKEAKENRNDEKGEFKTKKSYQAVVPRNCGDIVGNVRLAMEFERQKTAESH